jgi:DNA-binding GntR family transcriptional regulator
MPPPKREAVAAYVREMIERGDLKPGSPAPSGAVLATATGYSVLTCRAALRDLIASGTLTPGISPGARPRVAQHGRTVGNAETLRAALSTELASLRHAAKMTQPELAEKLGVSLTTVGHAETGRTWHSRGFWERAHRFFDGGNLLPMFDALDAAVHAPLADGSAVPEEAAPSAPALPTPCGSGHAFASPSSGARGPR